MATNTSQIDRIARITVTLDHIKPTIWRRIEVPLTTSLRGVHEAIQAAMLFDNYHLFDFHVEIDGKVRRYGIPDPDRFVQISDAKNIKLGTLIARGGRGFTYCYDFGDNWEHHLTIEQVFDADPDGAYPRLVDGSRRAPPEDIGGIPGFEHFLGAICDPRHPDHGRVLQWYGRPFDPDDIGLGDVTERMRRLSDRRARGIIGFEISRSILH